MRVRTRAGLPSGPWQGRAVLSFHRTAWFGDGSDSLIGVLGRGLAPSPSGFELEGALPRVREGTRLVSDNGQWFLEGVGPLNGAEQAPDACVVLDLGQRPDGAWASRWSRWLDRELPSTAEGRWLASLLGGLPKRWEALVGRGSGTTPSGDDVLAGWIAARRYLRLWTAFDQERLSTVLGTTAMLSRHFLSHLAQGRCDSALGGFLAETTLPEPDSLPARSLALRGDLSGRATLVGLLAGLTAGD